MRQPGAFAFLFLFLFAASAQADRGTLCVQTFNVYGPAYASNVSGRLKKLADEFLREPCDAIQLQELWKDNHYNEFVQAMTSARLAPIRADQTRRDKAITGIAALMKGSVSNASSELYKVNNEDGLLDWIRDVSGVQKGFSLITTKLDAISVPVTLLNTHTHPTNEAIRVAQLVQLADAVLLRSPELAGRPMLFAADTNATPESLDVEILRKVLLLSDAYLETNGSYSDICTYCKRNPLSWDSKDRVIDYVMYRNSPTLAFRAETTAVNLKGTDREPLSDHYGVRAILGWEDRESAPLADDSAIYQFRMSDAAITMNKAAILLEGQRKPAFRTAAQKARDLEAMFKAKVLPPTVDAAFRTP